MILDNVISGNNENGVQIFGPGSQSNTVANNEIGIGLDEKTVVFNSGNGVFLNNDGGTLAEATSSGLET